MKKRLFHKTLRSVQNCVELQCLVDALVDFLINFLSMLPLH